MRFSVVIATCDRPERLVRTLIALNESIRQTGQQHEVIVVDNGASESAREAVGKSSEGFGAGIRHLESPPRNKAAALNTGIRSAQNGWLAFTDDDAIPSRDWLAEASSYALSSGLDVFGGRVVAETERLELPQWLKAGKSGRVPRGPAVVDYRPLKESGVLDNKAQVPLGSNMFVAKRVFDKFGGYDEQLWTKCGAAALGCEDAEFGMRIRSAGERVGYCDEAVVVHPVYAERATLSAHVRWAWRNGIRDTILFPSEAAKSGHLRFSIVSLCRSVVLLIQKDSAASICELMTGIQHAGLIWQRLKSAASE